MNRLTRLGVIAAWTVLLMAASTAAVSAQGAATEIRDHLIVVYNSKDPDSKELATYYALRRGIPDERVLGIECSTDEIVTRADYNETIRKPIEKYIMAKGWLKRIPKLIKTEKGGVSVMQADKNQVWCMALIRGIPLKIAEDPTVSAPEGIQAAIKVNAAAVDSELALLPFETLPLYGFIGNLYASVNAQPRAFTQDFADYLILVTRLDAPTPALVRGMIDNAIATEKLELTGRAYLDARGISSATDNYAIGDQWIKRTADVLRVSGFEVELDDNPSVFPASAAWDNVAFYAGWYVQDCAGPFLQPGFKFRPGAVAYHIHSFSGETVRSATKNWVGPLLNAGATATMGCVYEPYLRFTPDVSTFFSSLLRGFTFAEAAYQSQNVLSWMTTMVGDPLYRPFPRNFYTDLELATQDDSPDLDWLLLRRSRVAAEAGMIQETRELLDQMIEKKPTPVTQEGYGDIMKTIVPNAPSIVDSYEKAYDSSTTERGKVRLGLKLAQAYRDKNDDAHAIQIYEALLGRYPKTCSMFDVPQIAFTAAAQVGWTNLSPKMQELLLPISEELRKAKTAPAP